MRWKRERRNGLDEQYDITSVRESIVLRKVECSTKFDMSPGYCVHVLSSWVIYSRYVAIAMWCLDGSFGDFGLYL